MTPDVLNAARVRRAGPHRLFLLGVPLLLVAQVAWAAEQRLSFNIPAQPLTSALSAYASATGLAALVDAELAEGRRSTAVKGLLAPAEALQILLAGTGLTTRYVSSTAFTLAPVSAAKAATSSPTSSTQPDNYGRYFADVQDILERTLCRKEETLPGRYRAAVQLWIGPDGAIRASHLLSSTGDERRDAALSDVLQAISVTSPPARLPQPVTIVLLPHLRSAAPACHETGRHGR